MSERQLRSEDELGIAARRRIAILAQGTRGDIQPAISIGDVLAQRGHVVTITVNRNLAAWARRSGLRIIATEPDYEAILASSAGHRAINTGRSAALIRMLARADRSCNAEVDQACLEAAADADLLVSTPMTMCRGATIAERFKLRHGILLPFPMLPTGSWAGDLSPIRNLRIRSLNRLLHHVTMEVWWHTIGRNVGGLRKHLGLAPWKRRPRLEEFPAALIFSEHLVPKPREWAHEHQFVGFCSLSQELRDRLGELAAPDGLDAWLSMGDAPVYFGFGSIPVRNASESLGLICEVARRHGVRALIGSGWSEYGSRGYLSKDLFVAPCFDHDSVLPRCRAAVHHGGAGTTAAALRAGLPSIVTSVFGDQRFWGWRVSALGAGMTMPFHKVTVSSLDRALSRVLAPDVAMCAKALGAKLRKEDGTCRAADVIEGWL